MGTDFFQRVISPNEVGISPNKSEVLFVWRMNVMEELGEAFQNFTAQALDLDYSA